MFTAARAAGAGTYLVLAACSALLCACGARQGGPRGGTALLDEEIMLVREASSDVARHELVVTEPMTLVAFAEELDTQVRLRLETAGAASASVEVENNFKGTGIEVAALTVPRGARVVVTLDGPQDGAHPGRVRLRLRGFDASAPAAQAYRAWSDAMRYGAHAADARAHGLADMQRAIKVLESSGGDPLMAAWARLTRAQQLYYFEIDWRASRADAQHAERAFLALAPARPRDAARARFLDAANLLEISMEPAAKDLKPEEARAAARAIFEELSSPESPFAALERARAMNMLGCVELAATRIAEAEAAFERALAAYRQIGSRHGTMQVLSNLGVTAVDRGEFQAAARIYEQVLPHIEHERDPEHRAKWLLSAGRAHMQAGNTDRAIDLVLRALEESRRHRMPINEGRSLTYLGMSYWNRGDVVQAEAYLDRALVLQRGLKDSLFTYSTLRLLGILARERGDPRRALELHSDAAQQVSRPLMLARLEAEVALDHAALSDYPAALAKCRAALAKPVDPAMRGYLGQLKLTCAQLLVEQPLVTKAAVDEATALAREVLDSSVARSDIVQEIAARRVLAQALAAAGDVADARAGYERAIDLIFEYRGISTNPELRSTTLSNEQATFRAYVDLLMRSVAQRAPAALARAGKDEEAALRVLELARARNFDAARPDGPNAVARARIDELLARMADKRVRIATLLDRVPVPAEKIRALELEIAELRAEFDRAYAGDPAQGVRVAGARSTGSRPWPTLRPRTSQLSYALGTRHAYVWVRDVEGIRAARLEVTPVQLDAMLRALAGIDRVQMPVQYERQLAPLSSLLLPRDALRGDVTMLEIVAEGRIASVPFAALRRSGTHGPRLIETYGVEMIGSLMGARAPAVATRPHALRLLAVAGGGGELPGSYTRSRFGRLRSAVAEAQAITEMFRSAGPESGVKLLAGADGSAVAIRAIWETGVDVVHFATHGLADLQQPLASLLVLPASDGAGNLTYLTAGQVQEWRGDASLVYLSACESAVGPARFAEGMPGLQRAFLRAGAQGVIATLWPIEDALAKEFATDFYRRMRSGATPVAALRDTQRAWLAPDAAEDSAAHRRMTAWAHVYYAQ